MATIKFDGQDYDTDKFSEEAKAHFEMLILADNKIKSLQQDLALIQTARNSYARALKSKLPVSAENHPVLSGDTIQF